MATMNDVAALAGVSTATVSHVINGTRPVAGETKARVRAAIEQVGYYPNNMARALKSKKSRTIGMIVTNSTNPFFAGIVRGVEDTCFENGYSFILCNSDDVPEKQEAQLKLLLEKHIDGLLVMTTNHNPAFLTRLAGLTRLPVAVMDADEDLGLPTINDNSVAGGQLAAEFLVNCGLRRIACITGPQRHPRSRDRLAGFRAALARRGVHLPESWIVESNLDLAGGYRAMSRLLADTPPPEAVFAFNDLAAVGAMRAAHQRQMAVPDQVSIIGYDDIELAAYTEPPLTTIGQPIHEMGRQAAKMMIHLVEDKTARPASKQLEPVLVVRETVKIIKPAR